MPELINIEGSDLVKNSRAAINNNFKTVACDFAGSAFPVNNVYVGMVCFRTDQMKTYRYVADNDWKVELDLGGKVALVASASFAQQAQADNRNQRIDATYIKGVTTKDGNIIVTRGDGAETKIPYNDNNDKVAISAAPSSSKEYAIVINKAELSPATDGVLMDTQVTVNPNEHSVTAYKFIGILDGNAKADSRGQKIDETYVKDVSLKDLAITVTQGDGTKKTFTTNTNFDNKRYFSGSTQRDFELTGISTNSNSDVVEGSGDISKKYFGIQSGISAGTYGLADILQRLVNQSHWHRIREVRSNCNCKCRCDCSDDGE